MTGDISQLNNIQIITGEYVSFAGEKEKRWSRKGGVTVNYGVLKFEKVISFRNDTRHEGLYILLYIFVNYFCF